MSARFIVRIVGSALAATSSTVVGFRKLFPIIYFFRRQTWMFCLTILQVHLSAGTFKFEMYPQGFCDQMGLKDPLLYPESRSCMLLIIIITCQWNVQPHYYATRRQLQVKFLFADRGLLPVNEQRTRIASCQRTRIAPVSEREFDLQLPPSSVVMR